MVEEALGDFVCTQTTEMKGSGKVQLAIPNQRLLAFAKHGILRSRNFRQPVQVCHSVRRRCSFPVLSLRI